eukprot:2416706-Rhodomonas_salina.3
MFTDEKGLAQSNGKLFVFGSHKNRVYGGMVAPSNDVLLLLCDNTMHADQICTSTTSYRAYGQIYRHQVPAQPPSFAWAWALQNGTTSLTADSVLPPQAFCCLPTLPIS